MTREQALEKGILENKIVKLKPILKAGKMIKQKDHIGYFMFDDAFKNYVLPRDAKTGSYKQILTTEELLYFSEALQQDLSFTKRVDNFWDKYSVRIRKTKDLLINGIAFNLSDAYQNLDYRIMKSLKIVASTFAEKDNNPNFIWYLAEENEEHVHEAKEISKTKDVWLFFGTIMNSKKKLMDILSVYNAEKARSKDIDPNATVEFFVGEVEKIVSVDPDFILECKNSPMYELKAMILDGVRAGAINKSGRNKYNIVGDSSTYDYMGMTRLLAKLKEESDDDYIRVKEQIDKFHKDKEVVTGSTKKAKV